MSAWKNQAPGHVFVMETRTAEVGTPRSFTHVNLINLACIAPVIEMPVC